MTSASFTPAVESIDGVDVESAGGSVVHFCTLHLTGSRNEGMDAAGSQQLVVTMTSM